MTPYQEAIFKDITSIDTLTEIVSALDNMKRRPQNEAASEIRVRNALETIWNPESSGEDCVIAEATVGTWLLRELVVQAQSNIDDDWYGSEEHRSDSAVI